MRKIVNYLTSLFCKHDYNISEQWSIRDVGFQIKEGYRVSMLCKKCGYHKSFWKF